MFKLIKIISSGSNTPDPCRMLTSSGISYKAGTALKLSSGRLANATATDKPEFIAVESAAAGEKTTLVCYPVSADMLFEVPISGMPAMVKAGTKVTLSVDADGYADKVSNSATDGVATIFDMREATKSGDSIIVRFI